MSTENLIFSLLNIYIYMYHYQIDYWNFLSGHDRFSQFEYDNHENRNKQSAQWLQYVSRSRESRVESASVESASESLESSRLECLNRLAGNVYTVAHNLNSNSLVTRIYITQLRTNVFSGVDCAVDVDAYSN